LPFLDLRLSETTTSLEAPEFLIHKDQLSVFHASGATAELWNSGRFLQMGNRDNPDWLRVYKRLRSMNVGQRKGVRDCEILADVFLASRLSTVDPTFATTDGRILKPLYKHATGLNDRAYMRLGQRIENLARGGFLVEVEGYVARMLSLAPAAPGDSQTVYRTVDQYLLAGEKKAPSFVDNLGARRATVNRDHQLVEVRPREVRDGSNASHLALRITKASSPGSTKSPSRGREHRLNSVAEGVHRALK
jgi:hypothetical protein